MFSVSQKDPFKNLNFKLKIVKFLLNETNQFLPALDCARFCGTT